MKKIITLNPIKIPKEKLNSLSVKNGSFYILTDTNEQFLDINNKRIKIEKVMEFNNEDELNSIYHEIGFYYIIESNILYFYSRKWQLAYS